jgi:ADP-ribose pyrophosphatase YjhB (NUDIX family)
MSSQRNPARAYVVVWFRDESSGETMVLNGRETAIYEAAFARVAADRHRHAAMYDVVRKGQLLLVADGANHRLGLGRNFSGLLMIGRSALSGGRVDAGETAEEGAVRELLEECSVQASPQDLRPLFVDDASNSSFFTLDLRTVVPPDESVPEWAGRHVAGFVPTSDKRCLEVVSPQEMAALVAATDAADRTYIAEQMTGLAERFCAMLSASLARPAIPAAAVAKLASDLTAFQVGRVLPTNVDALNRFIEQMAVAD